MPRPRRLLNALVFVVVGFALATLPGHTPAGPQALAEHATPILPGAYYVSPWADLAAVSRGGEAPQTMRNPAAVYCRDLGYDHDTVTHPDGAQSGLCRFPDGETCDDWGFLDGTCGQAYSACAREGLHTRTVSDGSNPFASQYAVCVDTTGATVSSVTEMTDLVAKCSDLPASLPVATTAEAPSGAPPSKTAAPASFDWRNYEGGNWLTPVKSQGICGSCWAFAAVGVAEATHNIMAGNASLDLNLSEQYLVTDCASSAGACDGGYKDRALTYIVNDGIPDEACLPYGDGGSSGCPLTELGNCDTTECSYYTDGQCSDYRCSDRCSDWASRLYTIPGSRSLGYNPAKSTIKDALIAYGPIAVSMGMTGDFSGGVYRCSDNTTTNHGVIIVGYSDSGSYWIVRNSWGSSWDGDGYFNVAYDNCAIQKYPYHALTCVTPAAAPSMVSPTNGATTCDTTPSFDWSTVSGATSYHIQVDDSSAFDSTVIDATPSDSAYTPASALASGTYYWRVAACSACGCSAWSSSRSFSVSTVPATAPSLVSPASGSSTCDTTPAFDWDTVAGATSYRIQVADSSGFGSTAIDATTPDSTYTHTSALASGAYYWRVAACSACGCSTWSSSRSLTVGGAPAVPLLVAPVPGASFGTPEVTFTWTPPAGSATCRLQVSQSAAFTSVTVNETLTGSSYTSPPLPSGSYYWRMSACGTCGCSAYTTARTFYVNTPAISHDVYLPMAIRIQGTPIVGLTNGGFEAGHTGWREVSVQGWPVIVPVTSLPGEPRPHNGSWLAWLGGDNDEIAYIEQTVTVTAYRPYLGYWHWIASEDYCGYDFAGVVIDNATVVDVYTLCSDANTGGWIHHVVDLRAYAGRQVELQIRIETDDSLNSNLFLDDVAFTASATVMDGETGPEAPVWALGKPAVPDLPRDLAAAPATSLPRLFGNQE